MAQIQVRIPVYSTKNSESSIVASTILYSANATASEFYVGVKKLMAAVSFELLSVEEPQVLSGGDACGSADSEKLIRLAMATKLPCFGGLYGMSVEEEVLDRLPSPQHERCFITSLIPAHLWDRFAALLPGFEQRKRAKLLNQLAHLDLSADLSGFSPVNVSKYDPSGMAEVLRKAGAQNVCYVISENPAWDAQYWVLDTILELCVGAGHFVALSCLPGRLYFWQNEEANTCHLIVRE